MDHRKPFFSVLMPTYNRAHLLPLAIKSVLRQTFTDLELVVSNGGSTDNTREVVESFEDRRIRYVESRDRLSIGDNYQRAYDQAQGEYISFLSDDDAFVPQMLERVMSIIENEKPEVLVFKSCFYFKSRMTHLGTEVAENSLRIPPYTGDVRRFDKLGAARAVFGNLNLGPFNKDFNISFLANAVYHKSVFSKISQVRPRMFEATPADGYLAAAVAFVAETYHCLNEPLHVWTDWEDNATASEYKKKDKLRDHYEKLLAGKSLDYVPLKCALPLNCIYNALFMAKSDFDPNSKVNIDPACYYVAMYQNLMHLKRAGLEVEQESKEFRRSLSLEPALLQQRVMAQTNSYIKGLRDFIALRFPTLFRGLKRILGYELDEPPVELKGSENNFENVLECAVFVGQVLFPEHRGGGEISASLAHSNAGK